MAANATYQLILKFWYDIIQSRLGFLDFNNPDVLLPHNIIKFGDRGIFFPKTRLYHLQHIPRTCYPGSLTG